MELVFNELSFRDYGDDHSLTESFIKLGELFERAKVLYGYTHLLFPTNLSALRACTNKTFSLWLNDMPTQMRNKILPIIYKRPFTEDYLGDKNEDLSHYYFISNELQIEQEYCDGLATADIMDIPAISLANHYIWLNQTLSFYKETETSPIELCVTNLATEVFLNSDEFRSYSENISNIILQPSSFTYEQKLASISLRDDHGKEKLQKFAAKIIRNDYVNRVVNSLPFNPKTSRFIKSIYRNGLVEIIMHWEDAGYGMVIETTGRNFRETKEIAEILRDQFDR